MPKAAVYTLSWSPAYDAYAFCEKRVPMGIVTQADHARLLEWISGVHSFAFYGKTGAYTARKERMRGGEQYWYAYRRDGKRVQKKYLGKNEALTIERLEQVAALFTTTHAEHTATVRNAVTPLHEGETRARVYSDPLAATRLRLPSPPQHFIPRHHLFARLQGAFAKPLTLVSAPAGSGKSTLLSSWLSQQGSAHTGWVSLESGDEPTRLWSLIFTAFDGLCSGVGESALELLRVRQQPDIERILAVLIDQLQACQQEILLVLDDYHSADDPEVSRGMAFLLEHLPSTVHVIISTRVDPLLPLARLRSRGQLLELRGADLRFTNSETADFLIQSRAPQLSQQQIDILFERTEGWVAGLQLAAIVLQGGGESASIIAGFSGGHRYIVDYLVQEVLERLPEHIQSFLLYTSILERLQEKLCEAVTGQPAGQATLEWLEQANLFLIPLDDERRWYRYHHLFAETLLQRLLQTEGALVPELHRRALRWFESQDMAAEAIAHAREVSDFDAIAKIAESIGLGMINRGEVTTIMPWLRLLPRELLFKRFRLFIYACGDMIAINRHLAAAEMLQEYASMHHLPDLETTDADGLEQAIAAHISGIGSQMHLDEETRDRMVSILLAMYGILALLRDDRVAFCQELTNRSNAYVTPQDRVVSHLWFIALRQGDIYGSIMALEERLASLIANGEGSMLGFSIGYTLTLLLTMTGQLHKIAQTAQRILWAEDTASMRVHHGPAYVSLGMVEYEWSHLEQSEDYLRRGIALCRRPDLEESLLSGLYTLVKIYLVQGDEAGARELLQVYEMALRGAGYHTDITRMFTGWQAQIALALGDKMQALRWMQENVIKTELTSQFNPAIEEYYVLQTRILLSFQRWQEAEHILHVLHEVAHRQKRHGSLLRILTLRALLYQAQGELALALAALDHALTLAEAEEYIRVFLDEGAAMLALLVKLRAARHAGDGTDRQEVSIHYLDKLILLLRKEQAAYSGAPRGEPTLIEPLSKRELEVLRLISQGRSNREVATQLVITVSTVKSHLNAVYSKLQVESRTQAIVRANAWHLL